MKTRLLVLLLLGLPCFINAATFTVTTTADSGAGSLRQAISDANANAGEDTITFTVNGTIPLASALPAITGQTAISGPGAGLLTVSGNNAVRVFTVNANVTLSGLTIANGRAAINANGAGIHNSGSLNINDCVVVNNQTVGGWGGGIYNSGDLVIANSMIAGNQANGENGSNQSVNSASGGGGAGIGGGIFTVTGAVIISNCTFSGNRVLGGNGGRITPPSPNGTGRGGGINGGQPGTTYYQAGQNGGFGGGGGGGGPYGYGGIGGFGGGGGGGGGCREGGAGGTGAGSGGGRNPQSGECTTGGGGGGAGLGGGMFVESGAATIIKCVFSGNEAIGGAGGYGIRSGQGGNGSGIGPDFYNRSGNVLTLTCPADVTVAANADSCFASGVNLGTPVTTSSCGPVSVTNDAPAQFAVGTNKVTWTAADQCGATASCQQRVIVLDTQAPAITCSTNIVVATDEGACSKSNVTFTVTANDNCGAPVTVMCLPPSGSTFNVGTNNVTCTARDSAGNSNSCTFQVIVLDMEPPSITCPANIVTGTDSGQCSKSNVTFTATVTDNCTNVTVVCVQPSGSTFQAGPIRWFARRQTRRAIPTVAALP